MTLPQLSTRIRRLHTLAMGLRKEHHQVGVDHAPLTLEESSLYAAAIWEAAKALDGACIPLGSALRRLEDRFERP
jgi:hypothetical protein